jgi:hypothetical protein
LFFALLTLNIAIFIPKGTGLFIGSGPCNASPLTIFSASAGAVRIVQAKALILIASGAAATEETQNLLSKTKEKF